MRLKNASILAIQVFLVSKSVADSFGPQHEVTGIPTILRQEVEQRGVISFARFMETALYCPKTGYYERGGGQVGRSGDFYTSVSVGGLFGGLLARQFAGWLAALGPGPLHLIEAHSLPGLERGRKARQIRCMTPSTARAGTSALANRFGGNPSISTRPIFAMTSAT